MDAQAVLRLGQAARASGKQLLPTGPLKANRKIHRDPEDGLPRQGKQLSIRYR